MGATTNLGALGELGLVEGDAKTLGAHGRRVGVGCEK